MSEGAQIVVNGLAELGEALKKFPEVLAKKYLRRAVYNAAAFIEIDSLSRVPVDTGQLRSTIAIFKRASDDDTAHYAIGVRRPRNAKKIRRILRILRNGSGDKSAINLANDAYYWRFLEFGWHDKKGVFHQIPFLRPAFEARKEGATEVFRTTLAEGVIAAAAEVSK